MSAALKSGPPSSESQLASSLLRDARQPSRRYLALFLPFLPIDRLRRRGTLSAAGTPDEPVVIAEKVKGAMRLAALDQKAIALGLTIGLTLADARARVPKIAVFDADPAADAALLETIADDCDRWTPLVALDAPNGLILDITGCAHLFGGEAALCRHMQHRMARAGLAARTTTAGTPDAAQALARFGSVSIVPPGTEAEAVAPLFVAALAISHETATALSRAGLKTIGHLLERPSLPLAARFGEELLTRLRRVSGKEDARIVPRRSMPDCVIERRFAEPIGRAEDVEATLAGLVAQAMRMLERRGEGGRSFEVSFFRADGAVRRIGVELGRPSLDAASVLRLYRERLDALADPLDPGFGFDLIRLSVMASDPLQSAQGNLDATTSEAYEVSDLVDRLVARFGKNRVMRFAPRDTHDPSMVARSVPAIMAAAVRSSAIDWRQPEEGEPPLRPLQMFEPPQQIETLAEVPDGPPTSFRWRRALHAITRAEGPERIAVEWWHPSADGSEQLPLTRDYYRIEDEEGRRFWVFRAGLYGRETKTPRWYMHGVFA